MNNESHPSERASPGRLAVFTLAEALVLMALWLVLSGWWDVFHVSLGLATVVLVMVLNRSARRLPFELTGSRPTAPIRLWRLAVYLPWLLWQMLSSGLYVAYLSLHPRAPVAPLILRLRSHQPGLSAQVVLGNSITLTPGTLTLDIRGEELTIHALTERTADGFLGSTMPARVARLFGPVPRPLVSEVQKIRSLGELEGR